MYTITGPTTIAARSITRETSVPAELQQEDKTIAAAVEQTLQNGGCGWLSYLEDRFCGILTLLPAADGTAEITVLYVLPEYRGLGAAYVLLEQAAGCGRELGIWLDVHNEAAQRLLTRFGFVYRAECRTGEREEEPQVRFVFSQDNLCGQPVKLDVPNIDQREKFPTGCESVSAVMALRYAGMDITAEEWISRHLPKGTAPRERNGVYSGADPWKAFPGDPCSQDGWGCFVPVICRAAETALAGTGYRIKPLYSLSLDTLCRVFIARGIPVILWATLDMAEGRPCRPWQLDDGSGTYTWTEPMHCLLMTGFDKSHMYFSDPMRGKNTAYPREAVWKAYRTMHSQAAVALPDNVPMEYAHSAGAVLYTLRQGEPQYLLVREKLGHIGFPKGHLESGETVYDAAAREIREETALEACLQTDFREETLYLLREGRKWKWVTYFTARYNPDDHPQYTGEVAEVLELPYGEAMETLTYENTRALLRKADTWIRSRR